MQAPETRYAHRDDGVSIGYQLVGDGPVPLVWCWGWMSHLDLQWTDPGVARFFERLGSFSRLLIYDKPGTGVSDPIGHVPTLEERVEDVRIVMDAARMERAAVLGESEAGPVAAMFAATYPERTDALIIYGSLATGQPDDDELARFGGKPGETARMVEGHEHVIAHWGEGLSADWIAPSIANPMVRRAFATFERAAVSPSMARGLIDALLRIDVRPALAAISAPTVVLHRKGDVVPVAHGRLLADRIPNARLIELSGSDHAIWTQDTDVILGEIQELLTGARTTPTPERVLTTVMFTDIVESTRRASELGDGALAGFSGPARAIACARSLVTRVEEIGLPLRVGVHTGECEAIGDDLGGIAVHIGARVAAAAGSGEVLVSKTVVDLVVGSGLAFSDRGDHELKGVPGTWRLFALSGEDPDRRPPVESPSVHMTGADRATVRLARRAPGMLRTLGRLAQRGS